MKVITIPGVRGNRAPVEVLVNPSDRDIRGLIADTKFGDIRKAKDEAGNIYVWDAGLILHDEFERRIGVPVMPFERIVRRRKTARTLHPSRIRRRI